MIGEVLKYMRSKRQIKQDVLAKQISIKGNALSQYETGHRQPTFASIEKIANICDFDIIFKDRKSNEEFQSKDVARML